MNLFKFDLNENDILEWMIKYYCTKKHNGIHICRECNELLNYAVKRHNNCPRGSDKPVCSNCEIHCYKENFRDKIIEVMKFSGPHIFLKKPLYGLKYLIKKKTYRRYK